MADEIKPQQDAEQDALNPAETDAPDTDEALTVEITELTDEEPADTAEEAADAAADAAAELKEDAAEAEEDLTALFAEADAESDTPDTPARLPCETPHPPRPIETTPTMQPQSLICLQLCMT